MKDVTKQFIEDMESAGYEVVPYAGRWFWKGPGVYFDSRGSGDSNYPDMQDVVRATKVRLQFDSPIAYPQVADEEWFEEASKE